MAQTFGTVLYLVTNDRVDGGNCMSQQRYCRVITQFDINKMESLELNRMCYTDCKYGYESEAHNAFSPPQICLLVDGCSRPRDWTVDFSPPWSSTHNVREMMIKCISLWGADQISGLAELPCWAATDGSLSKTLNLQLLVVFDLSWKSHGIKASAKWATANSCLLAVDWVQRHVCCLRHCQGSLLRSPTLSLCWLTVLFWVFSELLDLPVSRCACACFVWLLCKYNFSLTFPFNISFH